MKKYLSILLIFTCFGNFYGQNNIQIPTNSLINSFDNGTKVYIKKINYFEFDKNTYLVDSLIVKNDTLSFSKESSQLLYTLSSTKDKPITYLPLIKLRPHYTSMFCSNFYTNDNYLLLNKKYNSDEYKFLRTFYKDFTRNSFDKNLYKGANYKDLPIDEALKKVQNQKKTFIKKLEKKKHLLSKQFIKYIMTEIELGSINQFLNWYEEVNANKISDEFSKTNISKVHEDSYKKFSSKKWNINSIQYFRILERILNYEESKKRKEFNTYFENIENRKSKMDELIKLTVNNT